MTAIKLSSGGQLFSIAISHLISIRHSGETGSQSEVARAGIRPLCVSPLARGENKWGSGSSASTAMTKIDLEVKLQIF
jgi:hypothetical protein